jgi:AcrR family transcriptional regulator
MKPPLLVTTMIQQAVGERPRNAARTRAEILDVATSEFARRGFAGARVDEIAAQTTTTKRMIYYYFGGKEQLYVAVLERAFETIRPEAAVPEGPHPDPLALVRQIAERTFEQHAAHPDLVRLVIIENLHQTATAPDSAPLQTLPHPGYQRLERALTEGVERGQLRAGVDAADVFMIINSFCAYRVANRFPFRQFSGRDLLDPARAEHQRLMLTDLVTAYLTA